MQKILFENYKSFKNKEELVLKPITILIGKNSSGKSSVAKLPPLLEAALKGEFSEPLLFNNNGVEVGAEFKDLLFGRIATGAKALNLGLYKKTASLTLQIVQTNPLTDSYGIFAWKFNNNKTVIERNHDDNYQGFLLNEDGHLKPDNFSLHTDYIGPFRQLPERSYSRHTIHHSKKFGIHGEHAYSFLIEDSLTKKQLITKVSAWYEQNFSGWKVTVNSEKAPFYQIELVRDNHGVGINIKDVGQGMCQALPLVVRAMMPVLEETLIILEQPELHLHPAAHGNLAELFVQSTKDDANKKYLIETHSQNFLLRMRYLVAKGMLAKDDIHIYFTDFDEETGISHLQLIEVDDCGNVSFWPDGIFNESFEEAIAIAKAQKKRKS